MRRPRRRLWIGLGVVAVLIIVGVLALVLRLQQMSRVIRAVEIEEVDLSRIEDGVYRGGFGDFLVRVELSVTVEGQRITGITILDQDSGPGYEGRAVIERILREQTPDVDARTGATGSSSAIRIAVQRALRSGIE